MPARRFRARVARVVDGDTVDMDVDLGFHITKRVRFRLNGIDAWETRGDERQAGIAAKEDLKRLLASEEWISVVSEKTGKYGRWLGTLYVNDLNVNDWLVEMGHAEYRSY